MEFAGLIFEILIFTFALMIWLFASGLYTPGKTEEEKARFEAFRGKNGRLLRILALALMAIMAVNIYLHFLELKG